MFVNQKPLFFYEANTDGGGTEFTFNLEELIPQDIREAAEKIATQNPEPTNQATPAPTNIPAQAAPTTPKPTVVEPVLTDPVNVDVTDPDIIDKLIAGDLNAGITKPEEKKDEPAWYANEKYKTLVAKAQRQGVSQADVDSLIQEYVDAAVVHNAQLLEGLREKTENYERDKQLTQSEVNRLRNIEKAAQFDMLDSTRKDYLTPMNNIASQIKTILDLEGTTITLEEVLNAKDRTSLSNMLKDAGFADEDYSRLVNYWRDYREVNIKYNDDKTAATKNAGKFMRAGISPEDQKVVVIDVLKELGKRAEYKYIIEGIRQEEIPLEVQQVIANARTNLANTLERMKQSDDIRDPKFVRAVAEYYIEAEHNKVQVSKTQNLVSENEKIKANMLKLYNAYRRLAGSAKGINGPSGATNFAQGNGTSNGKTSSNASELEAFERFLKTDDIDALL